MQDTNRILKLFPSMVNAVKSEIEELKETKHEVILFDGHLIKQFDSWFIYRFEIPKGIYLRMTEDAEIYIAEEEDKVKGDLVSVDNQFATIKLSENRGKNIDRLTVVWHSDAILKKMIERLLAISSKPTKFSVITSEQLFYPSATSNTVTWTAPLLLPQESQDFHVNQQQKEAVGKALRNKVIFIWGAPERLKLLE